MFKTFEMKKRLTYKYLPLAVNTYKLVFIHNFIISDFDDSLKMSVYLMYQLILAVVEVVFP